MDCRNPCFLWANTGLTRARTCIIYSQGDSMLSEITLLVNIIVALTTGILAFATFMVARATKRAAEATEKTVEAQYKPWVVMYIKPNWQGGSVIDLVVKNVGFGPAYDICFTLPDYFPHNAFGISPDGAPIAKNWEGGVLRDGINYLAPGGSWKTMWGQYGGLFNSLKGEPVEITVCFKTANGTVEKSRCVLDMRDLLEQTQDSFEHSTIKVLEKQAKALEKIEAKFRSLR